MEKIYTTLEAMEYLKISYSTIGRYIKSGKLKTRKLGRHYRIAESDLQAFYNKQVNNKEENNND